MTLVLAPAFSLSSSSLDPVLWHVQVNKYPGKRVFKAVGASLRRLPPQACNLHGNLA